MDIPNDFELVERRKHNEESQADLLEDKEVTNWKLILVTGAVSALNAVENSVIGMGEWPYMKEIDDEAKAQFFGFSQSAAKCGHAVFALVFSIWSFKMRSVRTPMLASRLVALVACMIYLSVEFFPDGKRYVLLSVYVLLGVANSACTVLRGYIVMCSSTQDRPKAFAIIGFSVIVSIVVGPMLQLMFSSIAYPGYEVVPGIRFHVFSVPIWFSLILTVITAVVIHFCMEDVHPTSSDSAKINSSEIISLEMIKETFKTLRESDLNWRLISVCLFVKIAVTFSHALLGSIMSIIFMVQYGWSGTETVRFGSTVMIAFGVISCAVLLLYIFGRLGERLPQEKVFLFCTLAIGFLFVATYPNMFNSQANAKYNATSRTGCNPEEYSWCESSLAVNPNFFLISTVVVLAPSMPMMGISLDTVYSKILGNIDQNVAHGAMTVVDDVIYMITPILTTSVFTVFGMGPLWIMKASIFFTVALIWLLNLKRIRLST